MAGQTLTAEVAKAGKYNVQSGALVEQVKAASPAAKAGIKGGSQAVTVGSQSYTVGGDVIVKADSTDIGSFDDFIAFMSTKQPGDVVTLTLADQSGVTRTVQATLGTRP